MIRNRTPASVVPPAVRVLAWVCQCLGVNSLFYWLNRNRKRTLTYHNVLPDPHFSGLLQDGVAHAESVFEEHIRYITARFPCGTDLDDAKACTLTFDDGYANQYVVAHRILAQHGIKAFFFCALDLVRGGQPLLVDELLLWVGRAPYGAYSIRVPGGEAAERVDLHSEQDRRRAWQRVRAWIGSDAGTASELRAEFDRCYSFEQLRTELDPDYYALRFTAVRPQALDEMRRYGHRLGAHSVTHPVLTTLDPRALEREVQTCQEGIGIIFNCRAFSYPFGGPREVSQREIDCVRRHGFTHALANTNQPLTGTLRYSRHFLPRLSLPNTTDRAVLAFVLSGAKYFLQHRRLLPQVCARGPDTASTNVAPSGRIALLFGTLAGAGVERVMINLADGLRRRGVQVDLVVQRAVGPFASHIPPGVNVVDLGVPRLRNSVPGLTRYLRKIRPDALLSAGAPDSLVAFAARRLAGVRTRILTGQHLCPSYGLAIAPRSSRWLHRLLPSLVDAWGDGMVAVSRGAADDMARVGGMRRERIRVIYNPVVSPQLFAQADAPLEHPWFSPGALPVVLSVGRLAKVKDFGTLVRAFGVVRRHANARLLILGEGPERPALRQLVASLGLEKEALLPGFDPNPYAYMKRCAVFVLSSVAEALPTVLVEAMACGAPVIATDCPGGVREVLGDGQYGRLVPVGDPGALARAIEDALCGRAQRPPDAAWAPFTVHAAAAEYLDLLLPGNTRPHAARGSLEQ